MKDIKDIDMKFKFTFFELRKVCRYPVCGMCGYKDVGEIGWPECCIAVCPVIAQTQKNKEAEPSTSTN